MSVNQGLLKPPDPPPKISPGFVALMVSHPADLKMMAGKLGESGERQGRLMMSHFYTRKNALVVGPFMGAPYAVALLETLIFWGAAKVVHLGWCGAVSPEIAIGEALLPNQAVIEEGTSRCYLPECPESSLPDEKLQARLFAAAAPGFSLGRHAGPVWTTDALFNETPEKISYYRRRGVLAVEMETSALFTVAGLRQVPMGAFLLVSDRLADGAWQPGFRDPDFTDARQKTCEMFRDLIQTL